MEALHERVRENIASSSVWVRSTGNRYFIYCVGQSIIKQKAFMAFAYHADIGAKPLFGYYKGQPENSYISNMKHFDQIEPWLEAEESILLIGECNSDNQPKATLKYLKNGHLEMLGHLRIVSKAVALTHDSWTYDPFSSNYYVCA